MPELAALGGGPEREGETEDNSSRTNNLPGQSQGGRGWGRGRQAVPDGIPNLADLGGGREAGL